MCITILAYTNTPLLRGLFVYNRWKNDRQVVSGRLAVDPPHSANSRFSPVENELFQRGYTSLPSISTLSASPVRRCLLI